MRYLIKNGLVVSGQSSEKKDILIENEKIIKTGKNLSDSSAQLIDRVFDSYALIKLHTKSLEAA